MSHFFRCAAPSPLNKFLPASGYCDGSYGILERWANPAVKLLGSLAVVRPAPELGTRKVRSLTEYCQNAKDNRRRYTCNCCDRYYHRELKHSSLQLIVYFHISGLQVCFEGPDYVCKLSLKILDSIFNRAESIGTETGI